MSIALISAVVRHERRVRLLFDNSLAGGAFSSVSFYSVASADGATTPPSVQKAYAIADSPNAVELQLDGPLVQGASYAIDAVGVPAIDASVTPGGSSLVVRPAVETRTAAIATRGRPLDLERELFGVDAIYEGDFVEDPGGDLATHGGSPVLRHDLRERMLGDGLPWDPAFGLRPRQYVDAPSGSIFVLSGKAESQALLDDRVASATASIDDSDPTAPVLKLLPVPIGSPKTSGLEPVRVQVKA